MSQAVQVTRGVKGDTGIKSRDQKRYAYQYAYRYVNDYDREVVTTGDNPGIGLVLYCIVW